MPLHHGQLNFQHPEFALPVEPITVTVTVRGEEMTDQVWSVELRPGDGLWHLLHEPLDEAHGYDTAQMRRALTGAITKLEEAA